MYKRILLAYDGSVEGGVALREGAILARRLAAKVFVLSVATDAGGVRMAEGLSGGLIAEQLQRYREVLERGVARLAGLGMDVHAKLTVGEPSRVIGAYAREIKADLVVVGHHKRGVLERWWSGPTGAYLCDHVGCSVLIARNMITDQAFEAAMAEAGAAAAVETV